MDKASEVLIYKIASKGNVVMRKEMKSCVFAISFYCIQSFSAGPPLSIRKRFDPLFLDEGGAPADKLWIQ